MKESAPAPSGGKPNVVIAGQMPPPVGGQNIVIKRMYDILADESDLRVRHLRFEFTKAWAGARKAGLHKVIELIRVVFRALRLRSGGRIDFLLYPAGGPHTVPIVRDLILLPILNLLSRNVVVHFQAAGLAERLANSPAMFRWLCRRIYGRCAAGVALTPFGKQDPLAAGLEEVHLLPNAFEDLAGAAITRPAAPKPVLLSIGHLCEDKGVPQLIEAFQRLARDQDIPELSLVLVGEPLAPYSEEQLRADIQASGVAERIEWKGVLTGDDLAAAYRQADILVFSSVAPYESFGLVIIEAMQWSLPMVVTDWRGNKSVCTDDVGGVLAALPEQDLTGALERAIGKALKGRDDWGEWGERNRRIYEHRYTIERFRTNLRELVIQITAS